MEGVLQEVTDPPRAAPTTSRGLTCCARSRRPAPSAGAPPRAAREGEGGGREATARRPASLLAPPSRPQLDSAASARGGGAAVIVLLLRPAPGPCAAVREEALLPTTAVDAPSRGTLAWEGPHGRATRSRILTAALLRRGRGDPPLLGPPATARDEGRREGGATRRELHRC
jgi:hypothetical protein